ncbi:MAG: type II toxin-antitoxin system RelE/ParE family toxin [Planctomycetota bacterium]
MALRLIWLPQALDDLDAITAYIAIESNRYAKNFVERILIRAEGLIDLPLSGHLNPEAGQDDVRELSIYPYRLIYRIRENDVIVLAVLHGSRLIDDILRARMT